jgi:hypothetical protein
MRDTLIFHCPYNSESVEYGIRISQELGLELVSPDAIWREEVERNPSSNPDEPRFSLTNEDLENLAVQNMLFQGYRRMINHELQHKDLLFVNFPQSKATISQLQGVISQVEARYKVVLLLTSPEYTARKLTSEFLANLEETVMGLLSNTTEIPRVFSRYGVENAQQLTSKIRAMMLHRAKQQSNLISQKCQYLEELYLDCPHCLVLRDMEIEDEVIAKIRDFWRSEWL